MDIKRMMRGLLGRSGHTARTAALGWLALALLLAQIGPAPAYADPVTMSGDGLSPETAYEVTDADQLAELAGNPDAYYRLEADIDLTGIAWQPIGTFFSPFNGQLDGNGHTITGLSVNTTSDFHAGLFGYVGASGRIANLTLQDAEVSGTTFFVWGTGALVGGLAGTVENVQVVGGSVTGSTKVGGLVGLTEGDALIANSSSTAAVRKENEEYGGIGGLIGYMSGGAVIGSSSGGTVEGGSEGNHIGGLIGYADGATVTNSRATGAVFGTKYYNVGGLIGYAINAVITGSSASGNVGDSDSTNVGGLVGTMEGGSVANSYAAGTVDGTTSVGGLIGRAQGGATVSASYASGSAGGPDSSFVGGLIGQITGGSASDVYATGATNGNFAVGGLIGYMDAGSTVARGHAVGAVPPSDWDFSGGLVGTLADGTVDAGYYDQAKTGQTETDRGTPLSAVQMKDESSFSGWDFAAVWSLDERIGYPTLIRFDEQAPAVAAAVVEQATPDRIDLTFVERITADADAIAHATATVGGAPAAIAEATGSGTRKLSLRLSEPVYIGAEVVVAFDPAYPVRDLAGNALPDGPIAVDNRSDGSEPPVTPPVVTVYSPHNGASGVARDVKLKLTFNESVTPAAGKTIRVVRSADGHVVAELAATAASVSGAVVTLTLPQELQAATAYFVEIDAGAFRNTDGTDYPGLSGPTAWRFATETEEDGNWTPLGSAGFSDGAIESPSLAYGGGKLYVAYRDKAHGNRAAVMVYEAGQWQSVGPAGGVSAGAISAPKLIADGGVLYVAYIDEANGGGVTVRTYDESSGVWSTVGSESFSAGKAAELSLLKAGGRLYVAYSDLANDERATVMRYEEISEAWAAAGAPVSPGTAYYLSLAADSEGTVYLGYTDYRFEVDFGATVQRYDPVHDSWSLIGEPGFTPDGAFDTKLAIDHDELYVSFSSNKPHHGAAVMRYDRAEDRWVDVGAHPFSADQAYNVTMAVEYGSPYVAYRDSARGDRMTVMKHAGTDWKPRGEAGFSAGWADEPSLLVRDGVLYVAYVDQANGNRATVMTIGTPADNDAPTASLVGVSGTAQVGRTLTGTYFYSDAEGDPEGASVYRWYAADDAGGAGEAPILGATGRTLTLTAALLGKYVSFEVTPTAASGTATGLPVRSARTGPVSAADAAPDDPADEPPATDEGRQPDLVVIVNGAPQERIAKAAMRREAGRSVLEATVDADGLADRLSREDDRPVVTVPIAQSADEVSVRLTGELVKAMEDKQATLVVQTPIGSYRLPAAEVLIEQLADRLDAAGRLADIEVNVRIRLGDASETALVNAAAAQTGLTVVAPPVEFAVTAAYRGETVEADRFDTYVEREIPLPDGVAPERITTAVVLDADGSLRHVPTTVVQRDGQYYAVVHSLTNSIYTLIWQERTYADIQGHWAEAVIRDLASRLVAEGADDAAYAPDAPMSRGDFAATLARALGLAGRSQSSPFPDLRYVEEIAIAQAYGLVQGYEDGTFRPADRLARQEAAAMLSRAMRLAGLPPAAAESDAALGGYADSRAIGAWARAAMAESVSEGLLSGYDRRLEPARPVTRAEAAALIHRLLRRTGLI